MSFSQALKRTIKKTFGWFGIEIRRLTGDIPAYEIRKKKHHTDDTPHQRNKPLTGETPKYGFFKRLVRSAFRFANYDIYRVLSDDYIFHIKKTYKYKYAPAKKTIVTYKNAAQHAEQDLTLKVESLYWRLRAKEAEKHAKIDSLRKIDLETERTA